MKESVKDGEEMIDKEGERGVGGRDEVKDRETDLILFTTRTAEV